MSRVSNAVPGEAQWVKTVLGRPPHEIDFDRYLEQLAGKRILVTGAAGSIGTALGQALVDVSPALLTDIDNMDVRRPWGVVRVFRAHQPEIVFHLAGAKHAPEGERDPWAVAETNAVGTHRVVEAAGRIGAKVVLASTSKAANPETAYGASKLIAERMVLNAGGSVARFYNVVESAGNVFETWAAIPVSDPIPVTDCTRLFISLREAIGLLLFAAAMLPARFALKIPVQPRAMWGVASELYPDRPRLDIPRRRGDRRAEPRCGDYEFVEDVPPGWPFARIVSPHD